MDPAVDGLLMAVVFVLGIWLHFVLPSQMAARRNEAPSFGVLVSLVGNPLLAVCLLAVLRPRVAE